jgi:predicted NAD/FAD-binding protein
VLVVGAGVGGISNARGLLRDGHDVTVFEQRPDMRPGGGSVTIGYGVAGIVTRCVVQLIVGRGSMAGFLVGVIGASAGLLMLLQIDPGTIEASTCASRPGLADSRS